MVDAPMTALTPANQLTLLRMLLIPVLRPPRHLRLLGWALSVFIVAGITDALDGLLARRRPEDDAGRVARSDGRQAAGGDDVHRADAAAAALVQRMPVWLTVLVLSRDIGIVLTVAIVNLAVGRRTFRPSIFGKVATATFLVTGVVTLVDELHAHARRSLVPIAGDGSQSASPSSATLHYATHATRLETQ